MSRMRAAALTSLLLAGLLAGAATAAAAQRYDVLIRNGEVLDGTGAPARRADIGISNGRIARIGDLRSATAPRVIDAGGKTVTPGFIDMHSHADWSFGIPEGNVALNNLTQGITTVVVGQDGRSAWRVGEQLPAVVDLWRSQGLAENAIPLVGHGSVRREVMGEVDRAPTADELTRMRALVREAMQQGAFGISTGLAYVPGRYARTEEVIALTKEVKPFGGFYISHLRNQGDDLPGSVDETVRIGRESGVPVVLTHFKSSGARNFGRARAAMDRIAEARRAGVEAWVDVYPWSTSSDGIEVDILPQRAWQLALGEAPEPPLAATLPGLDADALATFILAGNRWIRLTTTKSWLVTRPHDELVEMARSTMRALIRDASQDEMRAALRAALADSVRGPAVRAAIRQALDRMVAAQFVIDHAPDTRLDGKTLPQAAAILGMDEVDAAVALQLMGARVTHYHMSEPDVEAILSYDFTAISTDGTVPWFGIGKEHPRSYGTFTRLIEHYVRERNVLTLPRAVRAATGLAADIVGLTDRGYLKEGQWADVLVFDPAALHTCATFAAPHCYSSGIDVMLVNGAVTLDKGAYTGALNGQVLVRGKTS